ncbi:YgfZ/GcvT domain-containing protein [Wenzhouxiangella sediminis]|uniref:Folate-binding protein n=1 Tax=Wenzhouxiangella sediminis TaxID=1792836 RepID=A0A3E1KAR9_9GAMM|nr:folate-binding protein YgfZ [Wenzhouxiangella sediminis]RFF31511.1 folate-binding protein [Wenzhouxiangella sediminis]
MSNQFLLNHLASFSIAGPDARSYAQSQFTADVDRLAGDAWSPLAWCDPKGRVLATMMARAGENRVDLVLPAVQCESIREGLGRFTIGRRVDLSESGPVSGVFDGLGEATPLAFDPERGLLNDVAAPGDAAALRNWRRLDLCQGLPWLEPESSARHLPQWLGLEELGAVAYDKGCYPGQEVIARLHYRGTVKYRLAGLEIDTVEAIDAHARITDAAGAGIGHWLGGMALESSTIGLAVLATRAESDGAVLVACGERAHSARVTAPETLC